ncbi:MAG: TRM11 family SAM-dependent methyltransferase [Thermoplasmata archaeon]
MSEVREAWHSDLARGIGLETTTLWDFPSQSPPGRRHGDASFHGVTPTGVVANLLARHTQPGDWVVDPMAGSGTTLDVARRMGRRVLGFDLAPRRQDIHPADAQHLPVPAGFAQLMFVDPPYGDNLRYSDDPRCLGTLSAESEAFDFALGRVAREVDRVLRPKGIAAFLVSDQYRRSHFTPVGFALFSELERRFRPVDIVAVPRRNDRTLNPHWEHWSRRANFLLRGFRYLLIVRKEG